MSSRPSTSPATQESRAALNSSSSEEFVDIASQLAYAFRHASSFFAVLRGPDLVFETANDAYYQVLGRSDIIGKSVFDAIPEVKGHGFEEILAGVMESGIPYVGREVQVELQRRPGGPMERRAFDFTYLPLMNAGGCPRGIIVHGQDVTDRVRDRMALEKARDHAERLYGFTTALSNAPTLTAVADAAISASKSAFPDSAGTIIARRTADGDEVEIFAVSELPGQIFENWRRFPLSTDAPLSEAVRTSQLVSLESPRAWEERYPHLVQLLAETGHRAQIVAPLVAAGASIGSIGIAFDSDRVFTDDDKQLAVSLGHQCAVAMERARLFELEKEARTAAETASRFKSEFLAGMSHELRTPLNAIGGYAELLEMGIHGPVTEEQRVALDRIQASRRHVQGLIDSVLELSRIEVGAIRYTIEPVPLSEAISVCEALTAPQMRSKGLHYSRQGTAGCVTVSADAEKLRQIILNLLTNAVKYTSAGGSISLSVECDGEVVAVKVSDTGTGIDAAKLEVIFQPFVQLNASTAATGGVGLGLAISRNLARGMGGELKATSEPGKGSSFTLTLPAFEPQS